MFNYRTAFAAAFFSLAISAVGQTAIPDPRGPVLFSIGRVEATSAGVQSTAGQLPGPEMGAWNPQWIWTSTPPKLSNNDAHFRIEFKLPSTAKLDHAIAQFSADKVVRLWINGKLVARGPDDPGVDEILSQDWSHQWLYTFLDIGPYLRHGTNVIAAEVLNNGRVPGYSLNHPGFAFHVSIGDLNGAPITIDSGASWQARPVTAYGVREMPPPEGAEPNRKPEIGVTYDARKDDDPAWRTAGFNAGDWPSAVDVDSVWGTLMPSLIPARMEIEYPIQSIGRTEGDVKVQAGNRVRLNGNGSFSVDFDRVLAAYASFAVVGPAGTIITMEPAETKSKADPRRSSQIILRDGITYFEHPAYNGFSTLRVIVSNATGPVEFQNIRADFTSDPLKYLGSFNSSDGQLNQLWKASRWLTQICMQDHYVDSPHNQEPLGDFGDYLIEAVENDYAFNRQELTRQDLRKFAEILDHADSVNFHTSYSLMWLQMLMQYYDYTGDKSVPIELRPTVDRLLAHFATFRGANGLLSEAPNYMFMDWVTIGGFPTHHPPAVIGQAYFTALYYNALLDGARLAGLAGDTPQQSRYMRERTELAVAFNRELWDPTAGLYRDGKPHQNHQPIGKWLPADSDIETHSVHANALAVLYDLAPRDRQADILNKLNEAGPLNVQPYFMHFVFAAEAHAGVFDRWAVEQMHRWEINPETQTFREMFNGGDYSHAWGGTPLIQMSAHILGVQPASSGYATLLLAPHPSGLAFANGTVPTPLGDVEVNWTASPRAFVIDVTSPTAMPIDFALEGSLASARKITVDGKPAHSFNRQITISGGRHHIVVETAPILTR